MNTTVKKSIVGIVSVAVLVFADQITKLTAFNHLAGKAPFVIIDGVFEFSYVRNEGMAWGMLAGQRLFFIIVTVLILAVIVYAYARTPWTGKYAPLLFIEILGCSGALGNFIDRCLNGYVHDFIYFKLIDFPVFNIADCYVVIAGILLVFVSFFVYKEEKDFDFLSIKKGGNTL